MSDKVVIKDSVQIVFRNPFACEGGFAQKVILLAPKNPDQRARYEIIRRLNGPADTSDLRQYIRQSLCNADLELGFLEGVDAGGKPTRVALNDTIWRALARFNATATITAEFAQLVGVAL